MTRLGSWAAFVAGVAFIVLTLDLAYEVSLFLRSRGYQWETVKLLFAGASAVLLYLLVFGAGLRRPGPYLRALPALVAFGYAMTTIPGSPAERFHFLEYGVLYVLALRAVVLDVRGAWAYPLAWLPVVLAGWLDETLQGMSPVRYYDVEDIQMNALAAALAALVCASLFGRAAAAARFAHLPPRARASSDDAPAEDVGYTPGRR